MLFLIEQEGHHLSDVVLLFILRFVLFFFVLKLYLCQCIQARIIQKVINLRAIEGEVRQSFTLQLNRHQWRRLKLSISLPSGHGSSLSGLIGILSACGEFRG